MRAALHPTPIIRGKDSFRNGGLVKPSSSTWSRKPRLTFIASKRRRQLPKTSGTSDDGQKAHDSTLPVPFPVDRTSQQRSAMKRNAASSDIHSSLPLPTPTS